MTIIEEVRRLQKAVDDDAFPRPDPIGKRNDPRP